VKRDSDVRIWVLLALGFVAAIVLVIGFFWYLDSVGTADGPAEGRGESTVVGDV